MVAISARSNTKSIEVSNERLIAFALDDRPDSEKPAVLELPDPPVLVVLAAGALATGPALPLEPPEPQAAKNTDKELIISTTFNRLKSIAFTVNLSAD